MAALPSPHRGKGCAVLVVSIVLSFFSHRVLAQSFPADFQWCVATAGHQIEGGNINSDWWAWEQLPGKIKNGERSGEASHHYERMEEDVRLMRAMHVRTYRFSIEWSRIEPRPGEFDAAAVAHYARELKLLKQAGIAPMVTMHHFVQPQWFTASGGWNRDDAPEIFLRFVKKLDQEFGSSVIYWVTFNEPTVLLLGAYGEGLMPPGETAWNLWKPEVQILKAHALAYHYMHERALALKRPVKIGLAYHFRPVVSRQWFLRPLVRLGNELFNWSIPRALKTGELTGVGRKKVLGIKLPWLVTETIDGLKDTQDFIGINYYTREDFRLTLTQPFLRRDPFPGLEASDLDWGVDPEGFYEVLKQAHELYPNIPFFITENGIADSKDRWRSNYIVEHLRQLHRAITELHHPVEGYCYWSLMDNFEWQEGFTPRFGLFEVDYANGGRRTARPSVAVVSEIFQSNSLPPPKISDTKSAAQPDVLSQLFKDHSVKALVVQPPSSQMKHPFLVPGGPYAHQFDWDAYFTGLSLSLDGDGHPLADALKNFLDFEGLAGTPLGYVPREIGPKGAWTFPPVAEPLGMILWHMQLEVGIFLSHHTALQGGYEMMARALRAVTPEGKQSLPGPCKPFLAQMAFASATALKNYQWLEPYYPKLKQNLDYWERNQRSDGGLFVWRNSWDSGIDNTPTVSNSPPNVTAGVDLQSYIYREYLAMAEIANRLKHTDDQKMFLFKAKELRALVLRRMWSEEDGFFYNVDTRTDSQIRSKTWTGFTALWAHIAEPPQAKRVIEHMLNASEFWAAHGVRTVSARETFYSPQNGYWNGPVWVISNYISTQALLNYGMTERANELSRKTAALLTLDLQNGGSMNECYNPETGRGVGNRGFVSWNLLAEHMLAQD